MIIHYLQLAVRNLRKYGLQSAVSILGLTAAIVCLCLSSLWLKYEKTYDAFHRDADRIYVVSDSANASNSVIHQGLHAPSLVFSQRGNYPEIEEATFISGRMTDPLFTNGISEKTLLEVDTTFFQMFDLQVLKGSLNEFVSKRQVVLTESFASELYGKENPIGKPFVIRGGINEVCAVVSDFDPHSIFRCDGLVGWPCFGDPEIFLKLREGTSTDALAAKLTALKGQGDGSFFFGASSAVTDNVKELYQDMGLSPDERKGGLTLIPLTESHKHYYNNQLKAEQERYFFWASVMLTICILINWLVFYIIRLVGRRREFALRMVHGAQIRQLTLMCFIETALILCSSAVLSCLLIPIVQPAFARLAQIAPDGHFVFHQIALAVIVTVVLGLFVCWVAVVLACRRTLKKNLAINSQRMRGVNDTGLFIQLAVSLCLVFCTVVMLRQIFFLKDYDWGYNVKGHARLTVQALRDPVHPEEKWLMRGIPLDGLKEELRHLPSLTEVVDRGYDLGGTCNYSRPQLKLHEGDAAVDATGISGILDVANPQVGLTVLGGSLPKADRWSENEIILTQSICTRLGLTDAVGKTVLFYPSSYDKVAKEMTVVAVVKDILLLAPTEEIYPCVVLPPSVYDANADMFITLHFEPKLRKKFEQEIRTLMDAHPEMVYSLNFVEDKYDEYLRAENNLSRLLIIITLIAVLIAVFGLYSIIALACRQRRKEIAIRKVHGAKLSDVSGLFIREYGSIFLSAIVLAYIVGTIIMQHWLQTYVTRTSLSWWLYVSIFLGVALLIALCVGARVWKTARENPADVVKSE